MTINEQQIRVIASMRTELAGMIYTIHGLAIDRDPKDATWDNMMYAMNEISGAVQFLNTAISCMGGKQ